MGRWVGKKGVYVKEFQSLSHSFCDKLFAQKETNYKWTLTLRIHHRAAGSHQLWFPSTCSCSHPRILSSDNYIIKWDQTHLHLVFDQYLWVSYKWTFPRIISCWSCRVPVCLYDQQRALLAFSLSISPSCLIVCKVTSHTLSTTMR